MPSFCWSMTGHAFSAHSVAASGRCPLPEFWVWFGWLQATNDRFSIDYSQGMVAGQVGIDSLTLGVPNMTIADQAFGLTTNSTADFHSNSCDGVFVRPSPTPTASSMAITMPKIN